MSSPERLAQILGQLKLIDDELAPDDLDPAAVIGDLREAVDAVKWRIDKWKAEAGVLDDWIEVLLQRKSSLNRKAEKFEAWILAEMKAKGWEKLPGQLFRIDLRKSSTPALTISEQAEQCQFKFPSFVIRKEVFSWDKKALKEAYLKGESGLPEMDLDYSNYIKFEVRKDTK